MPKWAVVPDARPPIPFFLTAELARMTRTQLEASFVGDDDFHPRGQEECNMINDALRMTAYRQMEDAGVTDAELTLGLNAYASFYRLTDDEVTDCDFMEVYTSNAGMNAWISLGLDA